MLGRIFWLRVGWLRASSLSVWVVIASAMVVALLPNAAVAQNICVDCLGPDRSYRCTVKDGERAQQFRGGQRALEILCISELARSGGHQSCRVNTSFAGPCIGQHQEIDVARAGADFFAGGKPVGQEAVPEETRATEPISPPKKGPPQTLEELARETVAKSKEQFSAADESVKKAGHAVGGAVQKTWDCVASLFQRCK